MTKSRIIIIVLILMVKVSAAQAQRKSASILDSSLIILLDSIYIEDQQYRLRMSEIAEEFGSDSKQYQANLNTMRQIDSSNLVFIEKLIEERGWLGADVIGVEGNSTIFHVIQHSNQKTQEKYLPIFREAVANKNGRSGQLALMEDRVALGKGDRQTYGSQLTGFPGANYFVVSPMIDPDNVDKRRAEVGLGTMEVYLKHWDMIWDVDAYKKNLPELEKALREAGYWGK